MRLPHLTPFRDSALWFFTFCTCERRPLLANETSLRCLRAIWEKSPAADGWCVGRFVVMPDHLHFFAKSSRNAKSRAMWLKMVKSVSARELSREFGVSPPFWQPDTFDHIVRSADSYAEKWDYTRMNPVRKGLVATADEWPWQGEIEVLRF